MFAIACTLLILEIRLPHAGAHGSLLSSFVALWPSFLAFALSFFVILVSWITHHDVMQLIRSPSQAVMLANGCALIYVTFLPFPTAALAANLGGPEAGTAVAFYSGTFVFGSGAFNLLLETVARCPLRDPKTGAQAVARIRRGYRLAFMTYVVATALALVTPYVALALTMAVRLHLLRIRGMRERTAAT